MTVHHNGRAVRLQLITIAWMLAELGVSAYSAYTAHSAAILAFGSDSLVETLSAATVLKGMAVRWLRRTSATVMRRQGATADWGADQGEGLITRSPPEVPDAD